MVPAGPFDLETTCNLQEILIAFYLYNRKLGYDQGSLTCGCQAGLEHKPHLEGETHWTADPERWESPSGLTHAVYVFLYLIGSLGTPSLCLVRC